MNKKIEHRIFLKNNKLDKKSQSELIQIKIEIFDWALRLGDTISKKKLSHYFKQLKIIDLDILENLIKIHTKKPKKLSDESILEELVQKGLANNVGRSTLRDLGLQASLGWYTVIGKYRIIRTSAFKYRYRIELK